MTPDPDIQPGLHERPDGHDPQDVRQGEVVLKSRWRFGIFVAGLAALFLVAAIAGLARL